MTDWLCWHVGTVTDPKWTVIAKRCNVSRSVVVTLWAFLLERAKVAEVPGNVSGVDFEDAAVALDSPQEQVEAIYQAMIAKGVVHDDTLPKWQTRQHKTSTQRVQAFRERQALEQGNVSRNAETPTDRQTDRQTESPPVAPQGGQTDGVTPAGKKPRQRKASVLTGAMLEAFNAWYEVYPHKVGVADAERKFQVAFMAVKGDVTVLIAATKRYIVSKPPDRAWANPSTWLHQRRWLDAPAEMAPPQAAAGPKLSDRDSLWAHRMRSLADGGSWHVSWAPPLRGEQQSSAAAYEAAGGLNGNGPTITQNYANWLSGLTVQDRDIHWRTFPPLAGEARAIADSLRAGSDKQSNLERLIHVGS